MERVAVLNNVHSVGFRAMARMLRDLGFRSYAAGMSFQKAVVSHTGGRSWGERCDGVMETHRTPPDALFVDAYPYTEARFRRAGMPNPLLVFWIEPRGPEALAGWRPGAGTAVLAQCRRVGKALEETDIPSDFFWAPYPDALDRSPRESFGDEVAMVIHNATGWVGKVLPALREQKDFPLALYGAGPPSWAERLPHDEVVRRVRRARCLLHPKPFDTPGYALLEAALQGVPPILTATFIRKTGTEDVWIDGETCLILRDTTYPEIRRAVARLGSPHENRRIGENARTRIEKLSDWSENRPRLQRLLGRIGAL